MQENKKILQCFLLGGLFILLFNACDKDEFLDRNPVASVNTATFFADEDDALLGINAVYRELREWQPHVFSWIGLADIASDDAAKGSFVGDAQFLGDIDDYTFNPNNLAFFDWWAGNYKIINRANQVIDNVPNIEMDENLSNRIVAEARFIRGYVYFNLVRAFGGVPLIKTLPTPDEYVRGRNTEEEIYALIIEDLEYAKDNLPEKSEYPISDLGRATKGAATGLLAKVYLFRLEYDRAFQFSQEVITSNEYFLSPDYATIFTKEGENGAGSVFEIQTADLANNDGGSQYNQVQGIRGTPDRGWGFNAPSDNLLEAFETEDPRLDATVIFNGEILPTGQVVEAVSDAVPQRFNQKAYVPDDDQFNGGGNIRILRYSEILLIAAEAAMELGNTSEALTYLNQVRARARAGNSDILPDVTTTEKEVLRLAIWHERRVELAMEHHRTWDLRRMEKIIPGTIENSIKDIEGKAAFDISKHLLFPLPQSEIDLTDGVLQQNPGY